MSSEFIRLQRRRRVVIAALRETRPQAVEPEPYVSSGIRPADLFLMSGSDHETHDQYWPCRSCGSVAWRGRVGGDAGGEDGS
ncbi:protein of unknown function [Methylocella tundrae]|uniref:Uncharacterized protein n=1 Tax=Methylocella tundrae TaxID=227605 RepID=A0A4U8Z576_METTU|nr:protein of unknown function [Methylocella tundrae]